MASVIKSAAKLALDRGKYHKTLNLLALRVPISTCGKFLKTLGKNLLLNKPRLRNIVDDAEEGTPAELTVSSSVKASKGQKRKGKPLTKLVLLNEAVKELSSLPSEVQDLATQHGAQSVKYNLELDYSHWSYEEVLREALPEGVVVPQSFETAGHIAHLNLRDEHMPFKHVIGEVLLDKNHGIKTVVAKIGEITNEFRVFDMEVLAGENRLDTLVSEHGCKFRFNYSEVYWNSRLASAHNKRVKSFKPTDVICDMTCGIGPFTIPAAKKGCQVYANDLNPRSIHWLRENIKLNKIPAGRVEVSQDDGRAFVRKLAKRQMAGKAPALDHVVINLPKLSIAFCDAFVGMYWLPEDAPAEQKDRRQELLASLPTVHCYGFSSAPDPEARIVDVVKRVGESLGTPIVEPEVYNVRNVAPSKDMMCVSFRVPAEAAVARPPPSANVEPGAELMEDDPKVVEKKRKSEGSAPAATKPSKQQKK